MKRHITITVFLIVLLCLVGCRAGENEDIEPMDEIIYTSSVSAEDCFLCGNGAGSISWGQNNIGIISLNSFEVMPIEINRYDNEGILIEENTGCMSIQYFKSESKGFEANMVLDADRGHADITVFLYDDKTIDIEKVSSFLCQGCLNELIDDIYKSEFGVCILDFDTKEITVFRENVIGFGAGDFYIHCDAKEPSEKDDAYKLRFIIFYCPLRYENDA